MSPVTRLRKTVSLFDCFLRSKLFMFIKGLYIGLIHRGQKSVLPSYNQLRWVCCTLVDCHYDVTMMSCDVTMHNYVVMHTACMCSDCDVVLYVRYCVDYRRT